MSSPVSRRRSRSHIETEHEADAARFAANLSPAASDGSKRMRLRGGRGDSSHLEMEHDDGHETDSDDDFGGPNASTLPANGRLADQGPSASEFSPGAILRVMLQNFVTYEKAEFFPGPNLNMVIGPNGTGKSSLVCAICLGLGYPASVLGRATSFGEFVKHGKETAIVEIELQKRPDESTNYVVQLKINREDNTRQFWLNGKPVPHKRIQSATRKLRIQIDNLCQFLPQEKVAEFAGLNPVELLGKTLQAAASEEMIEQQLQLKEMFYTQKQMQRDLETEAEKLRSWQTRQQGLQADVERLREREQIKKTVAELQVDRVIADYTEKQKAHKQIKEQKKRAQEQLKRLEDRCKPSLEDVNKKLAYKNQIEEVLRARTQHSKDMGRSADKAFEAIDNALNDIRNNENERAAAESSFSKEKKGLQSVRASIAKLEAERKNRSLESFSFAEYNHKIRESKKKLEDEIRPGLQDLQAEKSRLYQQGKAKQAEARKINHDITNLDSQEGQRLQRLAQIEADAATAYKWLQDNRNDFEKEVFGPPMLTCSVKDKRYSNHVQSVLHKDDFVCFIAQTTNDHKKLTDQFYTKQNLAVAVRTITTDLSAFRTPIARENLAELGLDGYVLDFIEGPKPVLAMLCSEKKIHLTGVSLNEINDQQYQKLVDGEVINSFATGKTFSRITRRREYGPGATSTFTRTIPQGKFWTDEPVDDSVKTELQQKLENCNRERGELATQYKELEDKIKTLQQESQDVDAEVKRLNDEKQTIQMEVNQWKALPEKIEQKKKRASAIEEAIRKAREELSSLADKNDKLVLAKADLVMRYQESLQALRKANDDVIEARVRLVEAISDVAALEERNADIVQRLEDEKKRVVRLTDEVQRARAEAIVAKDKAQDMLAPYRDPDTQDYIPEMLQRMEAAKDKTVESIDEDIQIEMAKFDVIQEADPGVLRDFEKRARDIEKLEAESATRQADMQDLDENIRALRAKWEPGLDELIRRINDAFSYNFEQISCAGEVGVHKDEDFDKWAVEIKVKFRENETLQKLDQHRQSGGERAVSTIFYLMSLQSMAQSPFRVVDEINQGMDPRNERMVHERMVEIACREHTSQYFLITPKLLSGLRYDERMRVLCIASGEYMPENGSQLDFARCVKVKRQLLAAASA